VQKFVKMSTRSSWSDPSDERAWTREYSRQQQRHTVPGELVVYVDHHPAPVPRQPAACTDLQLPDPQMTSTAEEESSVDASDLGDDDLLQEAVRPVDDSVNTTPAADATNSQLITADLVQVKLPPVINSDASVSRDTAAAGDRQVDEMEGEGIVESLELIVDSLQQAYNSVHGLNVTSDAVSDTDNSTVVVTHASVPLDLRPSVQENDVTRQTTDATDHPHTIDVEAVDNPDLDLEFEEESGTLRCSEATGGPAQQMSSTVNDPSSIGGTRGGTSVSHKR